jgi:uncharacterized protein (TIGR02271 family)
MANSGGHGGKSKSIPVIEEKLTVGRRKIETGRVVIVKSIHSREEVVDEPTIAHEYRIKRVPINKTVDAPVPVRRRGDTTILPVIEEVVVVEKRLVLREEVHITRVRTERRDPRRITLRRETVEVREPRRGRGSRPDKE